MTEWIKLISAQSNTVCEESSKKTISPEHVLEALKVGVSCTITLVPKGVVVVAGGRA